MKFLPGGEPAFSPEELLGAVQKGDEGLAALAHRVGMPLANVMQAVSIFQSASHSGMNNHPMAGYQTKTSMTVDGLHGNGVPSEVDSELAGALAEIHDAPGELTGLLDQAASALNKPSDTRPPGGFLSGIGAAPSPSLKFSYDDAFYHNQSGEITLQLTIESPAFTLQDVKLTVYGDIARPFNVNMEDFLGLEKKIVVTPTVFPTSSLKISVSCFDNHEQPHCWKGDAVIRDVEQTLEIEGSQHIHLSSSGNVGDSDINIKGMEAAQTLRRRKLAQSFRCEVILSSDNVEERRLAISSRADRIKAREIFARAQNRVAKGRLEKAYKLIREVEDIGFMLRDAQALRAKIEMNLSYISLEKARDLFSEGRLREAYEFLQERKSLVYNPGITELLIEIEDIGEDCKEALELLASGNLKEALALIESVEKVVPKYDSCLLLRTAYNEALVKAEEDACQKEADHQKNEEAMALELEAASSKEEERKKLLELESRLSSLTSACQWRKVFDTLALYRTFEGHSIDLIENTVSEYNKVAMLSPLGRLAGPADDDPDILLIGDPVLTIGRDPRNTIVLVDSSCKTGRSQGRIVRSGTGAWQVQRCKGEFGSSVQPIEVNDELLEIGESKELSVNDVLTFSEIIKMKVSGLKSEHAKSLEVSYIKLLPDDEEYLDLARWILMDDTITAGSDEESDLLLPRIKGQAFKIHLLYDLFWIEPVQNSSMEVMVGDETLTSLRPLFHNELISIGGEEYYFYQVRSEKELWLSEEELDERDLP
jgi:tetratricopeptide (TPR) repeat protein